MPAVRVLNLNRLVKKLGAQAKIDLAPVNRNSTIKIFRSARDFSPVDTGDLQRSVLFESLPGGFSQGGRVFTNKEYAMYQEFGTTRMSPANHGLGYMRPAYDVNYKGILNDTEKYVKERL